MDMTWKSIQEILQKQLKPGIFQVWIRPLQGKIQDQQLYISAPNEFVASWVRDRLQDKLEFAAAQVLGSSPEVHIQAKGKEQPQTPLLQTKSSKNLDLPLENRYKPNKTSNWRFSFESFLVSPSNQLAYAACTNLCCKTLPASNVFICSSTGLGKTHLLQGIGQFYAQQKNENVRVGYVSGEEFANQMILAIKNKDLSRFKARYRENMDILLLEDIHFFQGKEKIQEELLATIKALEANGKKIVFTSTFLPRELSKIDSLLASYFCSGFVAPIQKPDFDFRLKLIEYKAKNFQVNIPSSVSELVAGSIQSDIRQLESCIQNMALKARLLKRDITMELAQEILENYNQNSIPDLDQIADYVCKNFELSENNLRSRSRKRQVVLARNLAFYLARKYTSLSLKDIGNRFNRRHSTVLKGITTVEKEINRESPLGRQLIRVAENLN
jgi:chromosomal replication initiator protein